MSLVSKTLQKALDRVTDLKADLKEANTELKEAVEETSMYKAFLSAIKDTTANVPEKVAAGNAFKITLSMLTKKEEAAADS
jgi:hypothetical protein